jgi:hypothetical protein
MAKHGMNKWMIFHEGFEHPVAAAEAAGFQP